ncbi:hypothetical protein BDQ12DRAFT_687818 [Crucibulum laeve]|uniref:VWFA domain-containing protein n=1 Tax=Crucibulum laeve TaxID=68775 RepID=A0A5C3LUQ7_9AGAR|nr:hypothetical protein BDQ12DRAFT_687818 [Crucibulum laeve]
MSQREDILQQLKRFDTVFIVDDSGSMQGDGWKQAEYALAKIAPLAAKYDDDGIEIQFLNSKKVVKNVKSVAEITALFKDVRPSGRTPIGTRLEVLLGDYLERLTTWENWKTQQTTHETVQKTASEKSPSIFRKFRGMKSILDQPIKPVKPVNYVFITDGGPTDEPRNRAENAIVSTAERLNEIDASISQMGIQFVQVLNDPSATNFLKNLDDNLKNKYGIRDIVDTTTSEIGKVLDLEKVLLGAINRRVDDRG